MPAADGASRERPRLRALFISEQSVGPGVMGQQVLGEILADQLGRLDIEARHVALTPMGRGARLAARAVPWIGRLDLDAQPLRWHLTEAARARRVLRAQLARHGADVMHLHGHTLSLLARAEMLRVPALVSVDATVVDWHAMGIWRPVRRYSGATMWPSVLLERRAFAAAARVVAVSEWARAAVERTSPGARVVVHRTGVDLERFRPAPRGERERPRLLFVGGRFAEKGGGELIEVLGPELGRSLELDVVTPEPVAPRDGLRVHRLAPRSAELVRLFQEADLFCLPTRGDAAPLAIIEAMACGLPVLSYEVGAIGELLGDGAAGRVVPRGDRRALRAGILELGSNPELRHRMGSAGRALCERRHDIRVQAPRLVELMRGVAADRPERA
jgi:glycosyltransferase involved in cell wall biosynthesis